MATVQADSHAVQVAVAGVVGPRPAPLLEVDRLAKAFARGDRRTRALHRVSLSVGEGEFVSIIGPSGCGKSTFLHILAGFIPQTEGVIRVAGHAVHGPGPDRGMMFQELALYPWRSVLGNVTWALEIQRRSKRERVAIAERYLSLVGLLPFKDAYLHELSGGMKQRVALARLLTFDPAVLLMDEPFGALDAQTRELMQEELQRIWMQTRKTILFVTHDIDEAAYLADRVVVFTAGPGQIKATLDIKLPRPRGLEIKKSPAFLDYRNHLWDLLREEVLKARTDG